MNPRDEDMSDDEADRLTWKILEESGIPFSIDEQGCLHFDTDAIDHDLEDDSEDDDVDERAS